MPRTDNMKVSLARRLDGHYAVECGTNETTDPAVVQEWINTLLLAKAWLEEKQEK